MIITTTTTGTAYNINNNNNNNNINNINIIINNNSNTHVLVLRPHCFCACCVECAQIFVVALQIYFMLTLSRFNAKVHVHFFGLRGSPFSPLFANHNAAEAAGGLSGKKSFWC